jgi:hypothetical protein
MLISGRTKHVVAQLFNFRTAPLKRVNLSTFAAVRWVWYTMPCFLAIRSLQILLIWWKKNQERTWHSHLHEDVNGCWAKFSLIWLRIHHPKIDLEEVAKGFLLKRSEKKINFDRHIEAVSSPAEKMIDKLLEVDSNLFENFRYDESTQQMHASNKNIDKWM